MKGSALVFVRDTMSLDCSSLDPIIPELMQTYLLTSRPIFAKKRPRRCFGVNHYIVVYTRVIYLG